MEVNLSSFHHQEEKKLTKLFHINIKVKKTNIDSLFDTASQANTIAIHFISKLGLEVRDHPRQYPLG